MYETHQENDPYYEFKKEYRDYIGQECDTLFRGVFEFNHKDNVYSEENFSVHKARKDSTLIFQCEQMTRFLSGEILKLKLTYQLSKDWIPTLVLIDKFISDLHVIEKYQIQTKGPQLDYEFWSKYTHKHFHTSIPVPPRFQVATSCITTSCLFLGSKKYDPTARNYYNILTCDNSWECKHLPAMKFVIAEKLSTNTTEVKVKGTMLKSSHYRIRAFSENSKVLQTPLNVYLSKHFLIPYLVEISEDITIRIKRLQEIENDD